ncbi:1-acyl-sn-glycerol-3-phosphate acyltransferase [Leptospira sp. 201903075]|uniref:1-acyl-sn-glycerol-3-phosphate acyltransferase n=1 Tax=Leptospira chreensis TaxID=2810035 RepID=UPI00196319F7|nr:1-acyl-sn-glycerol-3-phosphate acyltransferase [Leptospira chreensis]MBM9592567.1 1-acyl-sn-glycerol-3-phosphate acyltransferase [Leptospira chreensis]MBM9592600.1 1-acyl-sn-glycerol-3-phosphate acyltransferase [Leptospira chreensis]
MKDSFIPPRFEFPIALGLDFGFPILTKLLFNIDGVEISKEDELRLKEIKNKRVMYLSNQPSELEPVIAYHIASKIGTRFHFMTSRSIFNWGFGLVGEVIKRVGAFSVISGSLNRSAIRTAKQILSLSDGKLVMYPEGMMSGENDNLVSFMPGVAQVSFWGLEAAFEKEPNAELWIQPSFVKYKISGTRDSILSDIESSLSRIERKLKLYPGGRTLLRRFLTVGRVMLEETEFELGIPKSETNGKDFDYRLGRARHTALNLAASILNVKFHESDNAIQKLRLLFMALDSLEAGAPLSTTPKNLTDQNIRRAKQLVDTAYAFIITKPKNLIQWPSAERLMEWICSFEKHIFGKTEARARKAHVVVAPAFSVAPFYQTYKTNKKDGIQSLLMEIRKEMEALLERAKKESEPIVPPYSVGLDLQIG